MANPNQTYASNGPSHDAFPKKKLYTVSVDQSAFNSTATSNASGGITPATWKDLGNPSSTNNAKRLARGNLRWRRFLGLLGQYCDFEIHKIVSDSAEAASTQIATLTFSFSVDDDTNIPNTGTSIDGSSTIATREAFIIDLMAQALNTSHTEMMEIHNATTGRGKENLEITAADVNAEGEIVEKITCVIDDNYSTARQDELPTDSASDYD